MIVSMLPSATNRKWLSFVFEPLICASICTGTNTVIDRLKVYIYRCTPMNLASCTSMHKHNLNQVFLSEKAPLLHGLFQLTSRSSCCFYFPLYYYLFLPFFLFFSSLPLRYLWNNSYSNYKFHESSCYYSIHSILPFDAMGLT